MDPAAPFMAFTTISLYLQASLAFALNESSIVNVAQVLMQPCYGGTTLPLMTLYLLNAYAYLGVRAFERGATTRRRGANVACEPPYTLTPDPFRIHRLAHTVSQKA